MAAFQAKDMLLTAAQIYYNDKHFSDFTVTCETKEFKVHRCFIAPHSKKFEKVFIGMFKEAQQRTIDLKEDDPSMVELVVKFFYAFDYDNTPAQSEILPLGLHARACTIADKYEVLVLRSIALAKFKNALLASRKDGKAMVEAAHALTECSTLAECSTWPSCDTTLYDLMIEAQLHGGEDLLVSIGKAEVSNLFTDIT